MSSVEFITQHDALRAVVIRQHHTGKEIEFFTDAENELQLGMFVRGAGYKVEPHSHACKPFLLRSMQEFIMLRTGKIAVTFYTDGGEKYRKIILKPGDGVLILQGGHSLAFLEKSSLLEVKQGPYSQNRKVFLPTVKKSKKD
jgi:hypothetical protein